MGSSTPTGAPGARSFWRRLLFSEHFVLYLTAAYVACVAPLAPDLIGLRNLGEIVASTLPLAIVAIGQTFVLITAGIDLSVTATIALTSVVGAKIMSGDEGLLAGEPYAVPVAVAAMLATGVVIGLVNGLAVARLGMPPFMVTLSAMVFLGGFAVWLTESQNISRLPEDFVQLAHGRLLEFRIGRRGSLALSHAFVLVVALASVAHVLLARTLWGRWLYAVGHNARTARSSGVPVARTTVLAYIASGACAAVASMLYTARLETGSPTHGDAILLDVIGAAVIGGTSLFGGRGKVLWTVFGALFITVVTNSLLMLNLSEFTTLIGKGCIILVAAVLDAWRRRLSLRGAGVAGVA